MTPRVGALSAALGAWIAPSVALAQPMLCAARLDMAGPSEDVREARQALAEGLHAELPLACDDARLEVAKGDGLWRFRLSRATRTNEHSVAELNEMVSWVESWLTRPKPAFAELASAPPVAGPTIIDRAPAASKIDTRPPPTLTLTGLVDLDDLGPLWPGLEIALRTGLAENLWLGVSGAGVQAPEREGTRRRALRLTGRLGWLQDLGWGAPYVGAGDGVVAAQARRRLPQGGTARDEELAPYIEASAGIEVRLSRSVALSLGALARAHLPDDYEADDDSPEERFDPDPLAAVAASFSVGVSIDLGEAP